MADNDDGTRSPVVIDNGSFHLKAGFAGDAAPRSCFVSQVLHNNSPSVLVGYEERDEFNMGDNLQFSPSYYGFKTLSPIQNTMITHWKAMEYIWHHTFYNELRVAPEEHPVLLTEPLNNPKINRERMVRLMFDRFNVPEVCVVVPAVLSLHASGITTGIVLDSGFETTRVVPIYEGFALPHACLTSSVGGRTMTNYMLTLLKERYNGTFTTSSEREVVRDMKETLCCVADQALGKEPHNNGAKEYEMPDGKIYTVDKARYLVPEVFFNPALIGRMLKDVKPPTNVCVALLSARHKRLGAESRLNQIPCFLLRHVLSYLNKGYLRSSDSSESRLQHLLFNSIKCCDVDVRMELYGNIVLAGGNTMFKGIAARVTKELVALAPPQMKVNVFAPPFRRHSTWIGGSTLALSPTFQSRWISKVEYDEAGASIVHRKCVA